MCGSLRLEVRRQGAELVIPAAPTPRELKRLSDIDDQEGLRFHIPVIQFYRGHDFANGGRDPAAVIRHAVACALVYYYPFAGRLREGAGRKLFVDCTGEGVFFIEAEADAKLRDFGEALQPPFCCLDDLLYDVEGSSAILDAPLLLIQVTRLSCGGFVLALRVNHVMVDAPGLVQLMTAVGELARGSPSPMVLPIWCRELFESTGRLPSFNHPEYDAAAPPATSINDAQPLVHRSFFFGPREISALRGLLPPGSFRRSSSTFEILSAFLWRSRTLSLLATSDAQDDRSNEEFRLICIVSARGRIPLPSGYYGNAFALPVAAAPAGELLSHPLCHAIELVRRAKARVTLDYLCSTADCLAKAGRPLFSTVRTYVVSDVTRAGFKDVDFGWGKPVYGGPALGGAGVVPGIVSYFIPSVNAAGEKGIVVPVCLPAATMHRFAAEIEAALINTTATTARL